MRRPRWCRAARLRALKAGSGVTHPPCKALYGRLRSTTPLSPRHKEKWWRTSVTGIDFNWARVDQGDPRVYIRQPHQSAARGSVAPCGARVSSSPPRRNDFLKNRRAMRWQRDYPHRQAHRRAASPPPDCAMAERWRQFNRGGSAHRENLANDARPRMLLAIAFGFEGCARYWPVASRPSRWSSCRGAARCARRCR